MITSDMKIPKKYDEAIEAIRHRADGTWWIYMSPGWAIDYSGELAHTVYTGDTQKSVKDFLKMYPIVEDPDFEG